MVKTTTLSDPRNPPLQTTLVCPQIRDHRVHAFLTERERERDARDRVLPPAEPLSLPRSASLTRGASAGLPRAALSVACSSRPAWLSPPATRARKLHYTKSRRCFYCSISFSWPSSKPPALGKGTPRGRHLSLPGHRGMSTLVKILSIARRDSLCFRCAPAIP